MLAITLLSLATRLPHILLVIVDDFGWGQVGYHRDAPSKEVQTPTIDALVKEGIELDRHCESYLNPHTSLTT